MKIDFTALAPQAASKGAIGDLIGRIQDGRVVPIVGNAFMNDLVFGSHQDLISGWESYTDYPLAQQGHDLARIAQYASVAASQERPGDEVWIKENYIRFLKAALQFMGREDPAVPKQIRDEVAEEERELSPSQMASRFNYPPSDDVQKNPLLILAALPLPIYITTSYHNFLETVLTEKAGKAPRTEICIWHEGLRDLPSVLQDPGYAPSAEQPLVYHLHGLDLYPESLVLTEDDHLDFLANVPKDPRAIHPRIKRALTDSSLVLIGYHPQAWDFRVIFRGLIVPRPRSLTSIAIQMEADPLNREYIQRYLRQARFDVEWKSAQEFIQELYDGWESH